VLVETVNHYFETKEKIIKVFAGIGTSYISWDIIAFDGEQGKWTTFEVMGRPQIMDLDGDGSEEMVVSFEGVHLNPPDVEIVRWNNGTLEFSQIAAQSGVSGKPYARLTMKDNLPVIEVGDVAEEIPQQYKYQGNSIRSFDSQSESNIERQNEINDFSIRVNDHFLSLKEWDHEVNLEAVLGNPKYENVQVLGDEADTHKGSYIKTLEYDGLQMTLFSPEQNGKNFWILSMDVTDESYSSSKGIGLGNTVQEVKEAYSYITMAKDGRTDPNNCAYEISDEQDYNYLQFEVADGKVKAIKIFHLIP
jgi:hypothetical protein